MHTESTCHIPNTRKAVTTILNIIAVILIVKANDCLLGSYVQVLDGPSGVNKHSIIIESMNKCTCKIILPKILHFPENFRFKCKEKDLHIEGNA